MKKVGLSKHTGTTQDAKGCEFNYTCYSNRFFDPEISDFRVTREYVAYDGKGTGLRNVVARAATLKELKQKMSEI